MPVYLSETEKAEAMHGRQPIAPPKTFQEKLQHFWDYRKWWVIGVPLAVAMGFVLFCSNAKPTDYNFAIYTWFISIEEQEAIKKLPELLAEYGADLNGDGKIDAGSAMDDFTADALDLQTLEAVSLNLYLALSGSDSNMLFITDRENYDKICESYGEECFASFEGAPRWVPLSDPVLKARMDELGIKHDLGISIIEKNDGIEKSKKSLAYYESAEDMMRRLKEAFPDSFNP